MIKNLKVMDATASRFAAIRNSRSRVQHPETGAMKRVVTGEKEGTLVYVSA